MPPTIAVVGTLDTKHREFAFLKQSIEQQGCKTILVDLGVFDQFLLEPDITRHQVASSIGLTIDEILRKKDRSFAVHSMTKGGAKLVGDLFRREPFSAIVALGGGTGTHITAGVIQALPTGIPKLIVSTVASRDMRPVIGSKDITLMHSVSDIAGLNFVTKGTIAYAAAAIVAMANNQRVPAPSNQVIGMTSYGPLNECASFAFAEMEKLGYEVVPFHAIGPGSVAMEDLVEQGAIQGVLDLSLHEFVDALHGGYCGAIGPTRLEKPGCKGIPHVILPGGLDMVVFECTSLEGFPPALRQRTFLAHDFRSFVRTTPEDMVALARIIADKLNRAQAPPTLVIPSKGWSKADGEGRPFFDPDTNRAFVKEVKSLLDRKVKVVEVDAHINDDQCARVAVEELHRLMLSAS